MEITRDGVPVELTREEAITQMLEVARTMEQGPLEGPLLWPCPLRAVFGNGWEHAAQALWGPRLVLGNIYRPADAFRKTGSEEARARCIKAIEALREVQG